MCTDDTTRLDSSVVLTDIVPETEELQPETKAMQAERVGLAFSIPFLVHCVPDAEPRTLELGTRGSNRFSNSISNSGFVPRNRWLHLFELKYTVVSFPLLCLSSLMCILVRCSRFIRNEDFSDNLLKTTKLQDVTRKKNETYLLPSCETRIFSFFIESNHDDILKIQLLLHRLITPRNTKTENTNIDMSY